MPANGLIGHSGFVGGHLAGQGAFSHRFNSSNIEALGECDFEEIVCAAAPGSMFEANRFPDRDAQRIDALIEQLRGAKTERITLISSIAVLAGFELGLDEGHAAYQTELAYGRNRRRLEEFCQGHFPQCLVVRLPALFGSGLKKNFLFDILNPVPSMLTPEKFVQLTGGLSAELTEVVESVYHFDKGLQMHVVDRARLARSGQSVALERAVQGKKMSAIQFTSPESTFQFYDMRNLWVDIGKCREAGLDVIHLAPEPIRASEIHELATGGAMPETDARVHCEDMRTRHAGLWGQAGDYIASAGAVAAQLRAFFASEGSAAA